MTSIEKWAEYPTLISIVNKQLQIDNIREPQAPGVVKFYPSSVGKCKRAIWYQMKGYEGLSMDPRILSVLANGNSFHTRMEETFERTGLLLAPELSLRRPELRISGRSDAILYNWLPYTPSPTMISLYEPPARGDTESEPKLIWTGPDNAVILVELKSISNSGFKYIITGSKEEHIMQLQLYLYLTGIKHGIVYYENKDSQLPKEFHYDYDQKIIDQVLDKIKTVVEAVESNRIPDREFGIADFDCIFCDYAETCRNCTRMPSPIDVLGA